jgi:hypothetical protein
MKTTLDLPDALVNEVTTHAQHDGLKLNDAVADLLRKGLAASAELRASARRPAIKLHPKSGLPYFECSPDASARRMLTSELVTMEHEILAREDRERNSVSTRQ